MPYLLSAINWEILIATSLQEATVGPLENATKTIHQEVLVPRIFACVANATESRSPLLRVVTVVWG